VCAYTEFGEVSPGPKIVQQNIVFHGEGTFEFGIVSEFVGAIIAWHQAFSNVNPYKQPRNHEQPRNL
jgi:hypothetical protein